MDGTGMNYTIDEAGIHFEIEPEPIPDDIALTTVKHIAAKLDIDLASCECREQKAPSLCGACEQEKHAIHST